MKIVGPHWAIRLATEHYGERGAEVWCEPWGDDGAVEHPKWGVRHSDVSQDLELICLIAPPRIVASHPRFISDEPVQLLRKPRLRRTPTKARPDGRAAAILVVSPEPAKLFVVARLSCGCCKRERARNSAPRETGAHHGRGC